MQNNDFLTKVHFVELSIFGFVFLLICVSAADCTLTLITHQPETDGNCESVPYSFYSYVSRANQINLNMDELVTHIFLYFTITISPSFLSNKSSDNCSLYIYGISFIYKMVRGDIFEDVLWLSRIISFFTFFSHVVIDELFHRLQ